MRVDILFLQNIWFESLGAMSLVAAAQKAGFKADVIIGKDRDLLKEVKHSKPRFVAFSCVTGTQLWALQLCEYIKKDISSDIATIMGGPHPTFFPEILSQSSYLDMICIGEGEYVLPEILAATKIPDDIQQIENMHVKIDDRIVQNPVRDLINDLDSLPFVNRESLYRYPIIRDNPVKRLISSRGCPHNCAFCFNHSMKKLYKGKGAYIRRRSVDNVIEELKEIEQRWPVETFLFEDDQFAVNKAWLLEFCDKYAQNFKRPFICYARADSIDNDTVKGLKDAGCYNVVIGVETGDERLRNEILNKNITDAQLKEAAALFHKYKINFCTTNILGLPNETQEQAYRTVTFTWELNPTFTWCSVFQPYPRTELGEMALAEKLAPHLDIDVIEPNYHSNSILQQPAIRQSVNLHKFFYILFNYPSLFPFIKPLLKWPPNVVFTLIHRVSFLFIYRKRWKISLWRAIQEGFNTSGFTRNKRVKHQEDI